MPGRRSVDRNVHLSEATRSRGVHCGHDRRDVRLKGWPLLKPDDDDRNGPADHVLLIPHVLVGRQEDLEARSDCRQISAHSIDSGLPSLSLSPNVSLEATTKAVAIGAKPGTPAIQLLKNGIFKGGMGVAQGGNGLLELLGTSEKQRVLVMGNQGLTITNNC